MCRAAPLLFLLLLHSPFLHAAPLGEDQRHQTIHWTPHGDPAHPAELTGHQDVSLVPRGQHEIGEGFQERGATQPHPPSAPDEGDELFKDISPKDLAAVLLKALNGDGGEQVPAAGGVRKPPEEPKPREEEEEEGLTERVKSRTRSSEKGGEGREIEEGDLENMKSLLQELEAFQPPPKREEPPQHPSPAGHDLEELRELLGFGGQREEEKRSPPKPAMRASKGWRGEDEGGKKLAGVAQDLLLQYLLNEGENEEEQGEERDEEEDYLGGDFVGGQRPLFEDEEGGNVQDKRSKEEEGEEVDPQTIDKLIELSSRLHLPADDVVEIINDVEKRKRRKMKKKKAREDLPGRKEKARTPPQSWPEPPKPAYYPRGRLEQELAWNKVPELTPRSVSVSTHPALGDPQL
ncbi:hypothetical protein FKM82_028509 [Ascaphus truei]